ncbi:MAG: hypothetical protein Q8N54_16745 [Sulfurimicrobium sp.]|jgi:hypothetical protein|nr:hypothetical protein [Sulfurimicrobium sp.]MDO9189027.1 hypothetical protein [Sulfurimicrobium sp.]MDP1703992.1 hypothetical protein [Sulfurimicrobium sp.]MDP2199253.1 hypothetical protein [Sulfurimicrobium sp.]MDP2964399.1 hypothetical protein [Sulfurimicrobium sp.]
MGNLEKRVADLEARQGAGGQVDEIIIRLIRPGDLACVGERRYSRDTGEWNYTRLIDEGGGYEPA